MVQLRVPLFAAAAGVGIEQDCSLVHALGWLYVELNFERKLGINPELIALAGGLLRGINQGREAAPDNLLPDRHAVALGDAA